MAYVINSELCIRCGFCAYLCLFAAPHLDESGSFFEIDPAKCQSCSKCIDFCPNGAIFEEEGTKHIESISINKEKCIGCSLCQRACPAEAITGVIKQPFEIHEDKCIKCGYCSTKCKKDAIDVVYR